MTTSTVNLYHNYEWVKQMKYHASADPPGMSEGPYLAPSSPPDTPEPTKSNPFSVNAL